MYERMKIEVFSLQTLCSSCIIRGNIPTDPVLGSVVGNYVSQLQHQFWNSDLDSSRLSGILDLLLATLGGSSEVWHHVECIKWFSCGNHFNHMDAAWNLFAHADVALKTKLALQGALTGKNYECLQYACASVKMWLPYNGSQIVEWLYENDNCFSRFDSTSLSLMCRDLGYMRILESTMRQNLLLKNEFKYIKCDMGYAIHSSCPLFYNSGVSSFMHKAVKLGAWDVIKWMMFMKFPFGEIYLYFCLHMDRFDMVRSEMNLSLSRVHKRVTLWIWDHCSPIAIQWAILNLPNSRSVWSKVSMKHATQIKLDLFKENGIMLTEHKAEEAAQYCSLAVFLKVLDLCRSWTPLRCFREARTNLMHGHLIQKYVTRSSEKYSRGSALTDKLRIRHCSLQRNT